jgi:Transcription factor zinc-finger
MSKKECVHCKKMKTKQKFEDKATCGPCRLKILVEREQIYKCPVDGAIMKKEIVGKEIIIDKCPECKGIWLDYGELEAIEEETASHEKGKTVTYDIFMGMMY